MDQDVLGASVGIRLFLLLDLTPLGPMPTPTPGPQAQRKLFGAVGGGRGHETSLTIIHTAPQL